MKALVLYDSKFGNTELVAEAVALALQESVPTRLASVGELGDCADALAGLDLLVVGGPTQRHGISPPLQDTLACLDASTLGGVRAAAFDTRAHGARVLTGSAAVRLARLLRHRGAWLVVAPESFVVEGREGPLERGELEHAREWALDVLHAIGVRTARATPLHPAG